MNKTSIVMQNNPAIVIINCLNKKQQDFIKEKLAEEKRVSLFKLYSIIVSYKHKEYPKEKIFEQLFGYAYKEKSDYLIRNEFRLLRQKLDELLIAMAVETEVTNNTVYRSKMRLFAYKQFGMHKAFTNEYKAAIELANNNLAFDEALIIEQWAMHLAYNHKLQDLKSYEDKALFFSELSQQAVLSIENYASAIMGSNQFYEAMGYYYNHKLLGYPAIKAKIGLAPLMLKENLLSSYHFYLAMALYADGENKINYFIEAFKLLENYEHQNTTITSMILEALIRIGRSQQQFGNFDGALNYLSKAVDEYLPQVSNYPSRDKLFANYITALMNKHEYQKALDTLDSIKKEEHSKEYTDSWFLIHRVICLVGLRKPERIKHLLPKNLKNTSPQHSVYFRLLLCFELYLLSEKEQCCREMNNLINSKLFVSYGKDMHKIVTYFEASFTLAHKYIEFDKIPQKEIRKLKRVQEEAESTPVNDINILPLFCWMKKEVETG